MSIDNSAARRNAWSSYWANGALHSCAGSYAGNYVGAIADFWRPLLERLQPGDRMLDIATGNGALPMLAWEQRQAGGAISIDAVDLATVAPAWHDLRKHPQIRFHSGVRMEQLPFADEGFDLVVSQYGLEYGQWPEALHECLRVCRASGTAAFILHHAESVLVKVGCCELENQRLLLARDGLITTAREVLPWMELARSGGIGLAQDGEAGRCKDAYNLAMRRVGERIEVGEVPDLLVEARAWIHGLVSIGGDGGLADRYSRLDAYRDALATAILRTEEMVSHALDEQAVEAMVATLRQARPGAGISYRVIEQSEGVLGWGVVVSS
ncbi:MAG: class I SAM-dependent methyltransferase [Pseudoxanthomonas sp.]